MQPRRLLWQLFPANLLITLGAIFLISWFGLSAVRNFYFLQIEHGLESRALLINDHILLLLQSSPDELQNFCRNAGSQAETRITVVLPDGKVLADSTEEPVRMNNHATRPEMKSALAGNTGSATRFSHTLGKNMLYVAIPLYDQAKQIAGALRLSVATTSIESVLRAIYLKIIIIIDLYPVIGFTIFIPVPN